MSSGAEPSDAAFPDYLYEEIDDFNLNERLQDLQKSNDNLLNQIQELKSEVESVNQKCAALEKQNDILQTNISSLFKTASAEISRKDRMYREALIQLEKYQLNDKKALTSHPTENRNFRETSNPTPIVNKISNESKPTNIENRYRRDDQFVKTNPQFQDDKSRKRMRSPSPHRQSPSKRPYKEKDRFSQVSNSTKEDYKNRSSSRENEAKKYRPRSSHIESSQSSHASSRENNYGRYSRSKPEFSNRPPANDQRSKYPEKDHSNYRRDSSNTHRPHVSEKNQNRNQLFDNLHGTYYDRDKEGANDRDFDANRNMRNTQVVSDYSNMLKNLVNDNSRAKFSEVTHEKNKTYHHSYENYIREQSNSSATKVIKPFDDLNSCVVNPCSINSKPVTESVSLQKNINIVDKVVSTKIEKKNLKTDLSNKIENPKLAEKIGKIVSDKPLKKVSVDNHKSVLKNDNDKNLFEKNVLERSKTCDKKSKKDTNVFNKCDEIKSDLRKSDTPNNVILIPKHDNLLRENCKTNPNYVAPKNCPEKENLTTNDMMDVIKPDDFIITKTNCTSNDIKTISIEENKDIEKVSNSKEKTPEKLKNNKKDSRSKDSKHTGSRKRRDSSKKNEKQKTDSNQDSKHEQESSNENPILNTCPPDSIKDNVEQEFIVEEYVIEQEYGVAEVLVSSEASPKTDDKDKLLSTMKNDIINDNITPIHGSLEENKTNINSPTYQKHTIVSPSVIDNNTIKFTVHRRRNRIIKT